MSAKSRMLTVIYLVSILTQLCGCMWFQIGREYQYAFDQPFSNVVKVEVMKYHYATKKEDTYATPIIDLDLRTAESLLAEILELPCYRHIMDPPTSFGDIILYIEYTNGEAEVLGYPQSVSVRENGQTVWKPYEFNSTQWSATLLKYVDADLVPELDTP